MALATENPAAVLAGLRKEKWALDATLMESESHILLAPDTSDEVLEKLGRPRAIEPSLEDVFVALTRHQAAAAS